MPISVGLLTDITLDVASVEKTLTIFRPSVFGLLVQFNLAQTSSSVRTLCFYSDTLSPFEYPKRRSYLLTRFYDYVLSFFIAQWNTNRYGITKVSS